MTRGRNQIHYGNDSWDEPGGPHLYGNLKALYRLKQAHRHLKVLLSIGGWTHSENGRFARPISTPEGRARFVETAVRLVEDDGLDGLDIDFEYSQNDKESRDYVELLRLLRQGLDGLQQKLGVHGPHGFELTVAAVSAGPRRHRHLSTPRRLSIRRGDRTALWPESDREAPRSRDGQLPLLLEPHGVSLELSRLWHRLSQLRNADEM